MNKDELIRQLDRQMKIRVLQSFDGEDVSIPEMEREFALAALDLIRRQPLMADIAGLVPEALVEGEEAAAGVGN